MLNNHVTLIGHLGADPVLRSTAANQDFATVRLAYSNRYLGRDGQPVDETHWFNLVAWGQSATRLVDSARSGQRLLVEGRLSARQYTDKAGEKRESVDVVVTRFETLPKLSELRRAADGTTVSDHDDAAGDLDDEMPF